MELAISIKLVAAGLSTIAMGGAGVGIGVIFGSLLNAISRNPQYLSTLFSYAILGFALTEAIALFSLMMSFLFIFALLWFKIIFSCNFINW